jgi:hypothetical protein
MPRYFIDMRSRFGCDEDLEGVDLPSPHAAWNEALRVATCKLQGAWQDLPPEARSGIAVEVVGEAGQTIMIVPSWEIERHLLRRAIISEPQAVGA